MLSLRFGHGEMAERSIAAVLKNARAARVSGGRIPLSPAFFLGCAVVGCCRIKRHPQLAALRACPRRSKDCQSRRKRERGQPMTALLRTPPSVELEPDVAAALERSSSWFLSLIVPTYNEAENIPL